MNAISHVLQAELDTFKKLLPTLSGDEGRYALVADDQLLGVYDTYGDAMQAGYAQRGLDPFLVKQIASVEVVANYTRHLHPTWPISASA